MKRRTLVPLLVAIALAGCQAPEPDLTPPDTAKQVHVERVRVQFSPAFAPGSSELSFAEAMRLQTFVDQARLRPSEHVYVAAASGDPLAASRIGGIVNMLSRRGVGVETVAPPAAGVAPNHLLLLIDRYVASQPGCPDWSESPTTPHDNLPNSNFGCATMTNFALMIDNPRDLVQGRTLGPFDADPGVDAVSRYRAGAVKPFSTQNSGPPPTNINVQTTGGTGGSSGSGASAGGGAGGSAAGQ